MTGGESVDKNPLKISARDLIIQTAIKNLLSAQERIAGYGSAEQVIQITAYLLKLADKRQDVLVNLVAEED